MINKQTLLISREIIKIFPDFLHRYVIGDMMQKSIYVKRIICICLLICFSLVTYGIINMRRLPNQVASVNALPITNKVVVVDAGHRTSR